MISREKRLAELRAALEQRATVLDKLKVEPNSPAYILMREESDALAAEIRRLTAPGCGTKLPAIAATLAGLATAALGANMDEGTVILAGVALAIGGILATLAL